MSKGITGQANLDTLLAMAKIMGEELFGGSVKGAYPVIASLSSTSQKLNDLALLEANPVVQEWIGAKRFDEIQFSKLTATIKKYALNFSIDRLDLASDSSGVLKQRLQSFAASSFDKLYDKVVFDALAANPTCYDGVALFSSSHPRVAGSTGSNQTSSALSFSIYDAAMAAMIGLRDDNSEPLGISPTHLIVGPSNQKLGMEITRSTERVIGINAAGAEATSSVVAAAQIPNVYGGGSVQLVVTPRLAGSAACYLVDASKSVNALHIFEMRKPEFVIQDSMDAQSRFMQDKINMSVEFDIVAAPAMWQCAYRMGV